MPFMDMAEFSNVVPIGKATIFQQPIRLLRLKMTSIEYDVIQLAKVVVVGTLNSKGNIISIVQLFYPLNGPQATMYAGSDGAEQKRGAVFCIPSGINSLVHR